MPLSRGWEDEEDEEESGEKTRLDWGLGGG